MNDLSWRDPHCRFVVLSDDLTGKVRVFFFSSESVTVCLNVRLVWLALVFYHFSLTFCLQFTGLQMR